MSKKILILRNDEIGDFILWLPYARFLREYYPHYHITILVKPLLKDFAAGFPYFDRVLALDGYRTAWQWRRQKLRLMPQISGWYDLLVNPIPGEKIFDNLLRFVFAKRKIKLNAAFLSPATADKKAAYSFNAYDENVTFTDPLSIWQMNQELINRIVGKPVATIAVKENFEHIVAVAPAGAIVCGIGASHPGRIWPYRNLLQLFHELKLKHPDRPIILLGNAKEGESFERECGSVSGVINRCGQTTITEAVGCIKSASLVISNETAIAHMGAIYGVKTVIISGGGHYGIFVPYPAQYSQVKTIYHPMDCFSCNWDCTQKRTGPTFPCIEEIPVGDVIKAGEL